MRSGESAVRPGDAITHTVDMNSVLWGNIDFYLQPWFP